LSKKAKGGIARAAKLTKEERKRIASIAARARWAKGVLNAICGSPDRPLKIADIEIPCYVLEDGTRVITGRGMTAAIGMKGRGQGVERITQHKTLGSYLGEELAMAITSPIKFRGMGGLVTYGYEATILQKLCDAILTAKDAGGLKTEQELRYAQFAYTLIRAFAKVGIIALIDEVTGYQEQRAKDDLSRILEAFIAKELQPWVKTFPDDYYRHIFRLRGLNYPNDTIKKPQYFGTLTNDIIYKRLAPGVLDELRRVTPRNENGRPNHKYFQSLTSNKGYPALRELLGSVVTMMKLTDGWPEFMERLDKIHPRFNAQLPMPLEYNAATDDGKGL
jgi:hypothetical protein